MDGPEFFNLLQKSRLFSADRLAIAKVEAHAPGATAEEVSRSFVKRQWLTDWQRKVLLAGKSSFRLGKYVLLSELGRGGMGAVYKAEQHPLKRIVALKLMSGQLLKDTSAVARFQREIQAAAALDHPNIVAAYDAESIQNTHFLVMEYVEGQTLADVSQSRGQLPVAEACEYIRQAAIGLQHAHERGMVHRDIKPANLLLTVPKKPRRTKDDPQDPDTRPVVKILDMGLARFSSECGGDDGLTQTGQIMGTPDYIAPEQARNTRAADIRSDIFSLGCTLFKLLTAQLPYGGTNTMEKLMARGLHDAPRVRSLRPDVPPGVDAIVARMLCRQPEGRYQTPSELAQALAPFAAPFSGIAPQLLPQTVTVGSENTPYGPGESPPTPAPGSGATPATPFDVSGLSGLSALQELAESDTNSLSDSGTKAIHGRPASSLMLGRRSPASWIVIAGAAGLAVVLLLGFWIWQRAGQTTLVIDWPESERKEAILEVDGRKVSSLPAALTFVGGPGKRSLRITRVDYDPIEETFNLSRGATETFKPKWTLTPQATRRNDLKGLDARVEAAVAKWNGKSPPADDPALLELRKELYRRRYQSPSADESRTLSRHARSLPWPIDQLQARDLSDLEKTVFAVENPGGAVALLVGTFGDSQLKFTGDLYDLSFSDKEDTFWVCTRDGVVARWDLRTRKLMRAFVISPVIWAAAFTRDGTGLVAGHDDGRLRIWNLDSGETLATTDEVPKNGFIRTDTRGRAVSTHDDHSLRTWDLKTASQLWNVAVKGQTRGLELSRDGRRIVTVEEPLGERWLMRIRSGETGEVQQTINEEDDYWWTALSPDGRRLYHGGSRQTVSRDLENPTVEPDPISNKVSFHAALSDDGRTLIVGNRDGGDVEVYDVNEKKLLAAFKVANWSDAMSLFVRPRGDEVLAIGNGQRVHHWRVRPEPEELFVAKGMGTGLHSALILPDGQAMATISHRYLAFWDVATRTMKDRVWTDSSYNSVVAPDAETLFVPADRCVMRWDLKTLAQGINLLGADNWIFSGAFRPDGKAFATTDYTYHLTEWDFPKETVRRRVPGANASATYSGDGEYLVTFNDQKFSVWSTSGGDVPVGMHGSAQIEGQFLFGTNDLLTLSYEGMLNLWSIPEAETKDVVQAYGDNAPWPHVIVSPSGRFAATWRGDSQVKLWSLKDRKIYPLGSPLVFTSPLGKPYSVSFTPEERHLLVANSNGTVAVFRLNPVLAR